MQSSSPWVAETDPTSGLDFYYNNDTGETTWTPPPGFGARPSDFATPVTKSAWISEVDPASGDTFYVNEATGETTWDRPADYVTLDDLRGGGSGGPRDNEKSLKSSKWKRAFAAVRTMVALNSKFKKPSWEKHFDEETGEYFYHNTVTGRSTWEEPPGFNGIPTLERGPRVLFQTSPKAGTASEEEEEEETKSTSRPNSKSRQSRSSKDKRSKKAEEKARATARATAAEKNKNKKKTKNAFDVQPILMAAESGDVDELLACMEKGVASASLHRGRSLFSGANSGLATDEAAKEESKKGEGDSGSGGAKDQKEEKGGEGDEEGEGEGEPVKVISEKAKDVYRVLEYKRKRFQPVINQANARGLTALHIACVKGNEAVVRRLIDLGADLNVRDKSMNTPLHFAVQKAHLRCVYIMLRAGADPSLRTKWGQCPYDIAKNQGYQRIAQLFEQGEKEFNIIQLFVDRKWYKVDVHLVRHGKTMCVPIDDSTFYVKTKYRTKAHSHHPDLH